MLIVRIHHFCTGFPLDYIKPSLISSICICFKTCFRTRIFGIVKPTPTSTIFSGMCVCVFVALKPYDQSTQFIIFTFRWYLSRDVLSQAQHAFPPQFEGQVHLSPTTINAHGDFLATGTQSTISLIGFAEHFSKAINFANHCEKCLAVVTGSLHNSSRFC